MKTTYADATQAQAIERAETDYRAGKLRPYPSRITQALDLGGHYGPQVDAACLAREPAVDRWEAGSAIPSWEQLCALGELTGMSVLWFFREPILDHGHMFICGRGVSNTLTVIPGESHYRFGDPTPDANVVPLIKDTLW